ncbi:hypothetical protein GIB67_035638, partial [Kingdonia uniflora]
SSSCNKANKNGRGYAKPWSEWDNGKIKILEWNEDCQPLGPNEPKLMSHLEEERETNIEARDKIFKDVIGEDGHGRVLCKGVVAHPKNARARSQIEVKRLMQIAGIFFRIIISIVESQS